MRKDSFRGQVMAAVMALSLAAGSMAAPAFAESTDTQTQGIAAEDWLPIGSVVKVKNFHRSFMILGRAIQNATDDKFYEYCACLFPDGYMGGDLYFFNQDDIDKVESKGFEDEYEQMYRLSHLDGLDAKALEEKAKSLETETETASSETEIPETQPETAPASETAETTETPKQTEAPAQAGTQTATEAPKTTEAQAEASGEAKTYTTTDNVRLRAEASTDSDSLITVPGNRQVKEDTSRQKKGDWVPVIFTDSTGAPLSGWIKEEFLK